MILKEDLYMISEILAKLIKRVKPTVNIHN